MSLLEPEDLAFMREAQAEARPTQAELVKRTETRDGRGGRTQGLATPEPLAIRVTSPADSTSTDDVPTELAGRYGATNLVKITTDLVAIAVGDYLHDLERDRWYQAVSNGETQEWTTAQTVWATRTVAP